MVKTWNQLSLETRLSAQERYEELRKEVMKLDKRIKELESQKEELTDSTEEDK